MKIEGKIIKISDFISYPKKSFPYTKKNPDNLLSGEGEPHISWTLEHKAEAAGGRV